MVETAQYAKMLVRTLHEYYDHPSFSFIFREMNKNEHRSEIEKALFFKVQGS